MPKDRFFNLPKEKQARIIQAARQEMSRVAVHDISINKIIQSAGIARGSFYQYFNDKEDLLNYVLEDYKVLMKNVVEKNLHNENSDIFDIASDLLKKTVEFGTKNENYAFCKNIFSNLSFKKNDILEWLKAGEEEVPEEFIPLINISKFKYDTKEDLRDLIEMLMVEVSCSIARVFLDVREEKGVIESFENKMKFLKYGMLKERQNGE